MTADHGRHVLPWWDRRQPTLVREAARRAGFRTGPYVDGWLQLVDPHTAEVAASVKFTPSGSAVRANLSPADGQPSTEVAAGAYALTARELTDTIVAWLAAGRPDDIVACMPNPFTATNRESRS